MNIYSLPSRVYMCVYIISGLLLELGKQHICKSVTPLTERSDLPPEFIRFPGQSRHVIKIGYYIMQWIVLQ